MTISTEQAKERAAKASKTRQQTERLRIASYAWLLKDRLTGLEERLPTLLRKQNSVVKNLYKILYQEHVRLGIDEDGQSFGSEASLAKYDTKMDAEIAFIQRHQTDGLKLQKKHFTHMGKEMPTSPSGKIDWKAISVDEINELREFLSEEQVEELLAAAKAAEAQQEAA